MKNSRKRNRYKKQQYIPSKYILMGITFVCICTIFLSLVANISGGPLNSVAGYVFTPMQRGINSVGSWVTSKTNDLQTLRDVQKENKKHTI